MTTLAAALLCWALFLALVAPRFWRDLPGSAFVAFAGLTLASLLRELASEPLFPFDQHAAFAAGAAAAFFGLLFFPHWLRSLPARAAAAIIRLALPPTRRRRPRAPRRNPSKSPAIVPGASAGKAQQKAGDIAQRLPGILCVLLVLWGMLEVLAIVLLGRPAAASEYFDQKVVAYFVALAGVWAVYFMSLGGVNRVAVWAEKRREQHYRHPARSQTTHVK
jgi:hypothetical protein